MELNDSVFGTLAELAMGADLPTAVAPGSAEAHGVAFRHWLALPARERILDLQCYLAAQGTNGMRLLELWVGERYYKDLAPAAASLAERAAFAEAFRDTALALLHGARASRRTAWAPRSLGVAARNRLGGALRGRSSSRQRLRTS